jgi:hypothetical protein
VSFLIDYVVGITISFFLVDIMGNVFLKRGSSPADTVWVSRANAMQRKGRAGRVRQALQSFLLLTKFSDQFFLFVFVRDNCY